MASLPRTTWIALKDLLALPDAPPGLLDSLLAAISANRLMAYRPRKGREPEPLPAAFFDGVARQKNGIIGFSLAWDGAMSVEREGLKFNDVVFHRDDITELVDPIYPKLLALGREILAEPRKLGIKKARRDVFMEKAAQQFPGCSKVAEAVWKEISPHKRRGRPSSESTPDDPEL